MGAVESTPPSDLAVRRLDEFLARSWTPAQLVAFHTQHKLELFSHHVQNYRALGRLVASSGSENRDELESRYRALFLQTLEVPQTRERHVDTMSHALGHFRGRTDSATRRALRELIEQYRSGAAELDRVRCELHSSAQEHEISYLLHQTYFSGLRSPGAG